MELKFDTPDEIDRYLFSDDMNPPVVCYSFSGTDDSGRTITIHRLRDGKITFSDTV